MLETFITKRFSAESERLLSIINPILIDYGRQGFDLSLRQLYYQLVSRNVVENTERSYKNIGNLVSDARLAGILDWGMIKDRGRETLMNPHWNGGKGEFLRSVAGQYRFDLWNDQPCYLEVMVEKQALEGVLEPVCRRMDVPFTSNKGYTSSSALYETSKRFVEAYEQGRSLHCVYLGDHDPSGIDMTRDIVDRLDLFVKTSTGREYEIGPNEEPAVEVHRVALNMDQIRQLRPPENPAKLTDSRAGDYISKYGSKSWELDAVEPRKLAQLVEDAIRSVLDEGKFEASLSRMESDRDIMRKMAREWEKENEGQ